MHIIYSSKNGRQVVRAISAGEDIPALIRTEDGNIGCWSCGANVRRTAQNAFICIECGCEMAIGHGKCVTLSMTPDGSILSKVTLVGGLHQNIDVLSNGDVVVFPEPGHGDFSIDHHDPIGITPLKLLMEAADFRRKSGSAA
ncbi:hypothetical protein [Rhizobium sp. AB2/73]|uniref:hypothetical protein n=1 Tax=Rhizobium sp. AB2/73 TaxID=2795216 RepID=UPI0013AFFF00|nr:hypothetical protein [Rhizobium sp. AB2/73]QYA11720.1 hypothetical protein J5284_14405 [Rhizobium sp. AB2/73]UEQ82350.1 hypothetical protein I8E17_07600 [Rhizobium sp. AB2/73]